MPLHRLQMARLLDLCANIFLELMTGLSSILFTALVILLVKSVPDCVHVSEVWSDQCR